MKPEFRPLFLPVVKNTNVIYFVPTPSSIYVLDGENQSDWLKAGGIAYSIFNSHKKSIMLGWRYLNDEFHYTPYHHKSNGDIVRYDKPQTVTGTGYIVGKLYEPIKMTIRRFDDGLIIKLENLASNQVTVLTSSGKFPKLGRRIISWFGGTLPPSHKVSYYLYWNCEDNKVWEKIKKVYSEPIKDERSQNSVHS